MPHGLRITKDNIYVFTSFTAFGPFFTDRGHNELCKACVRHIYGWNERQ